MATVKKVRLGFIGAGWWATANHMPILARRDDVELAAVCRLGRAELKQLQDTFGFPFDEETVPVTLAPCPSPATHCRACCCSRSTVMISARGLTAVVEGWDNVIDFPLR